MRRSAIVIGLLAAMIVATSSPASAAQPDVTHLHDEGSQLPVEDCGTFLVLLDFSHDETITTFFDSSGAPIRSQTRFSFQATLTNSVTGKAAYENGSYSITTDLASGATRVAGLVLLTRMPGSGVVILELGHVTFDASGSPSLSGNPRILQGGSLFCSILA